MHIQRGPLLKALRGRRDPQIGRSKFSVTPRRWCEGSRWWGTQGSGWEDGSECNHMCMGQSSHWTARLLAVPYECCFPVPSTVPVPLCVLRAPLLSEWLPPADLLPTLDFCLPLPLRGTPLGLGRAQLCESLDWAAIACPVWVLGGQGRKGVREESGLGRTSEYFGIHELLRLKRIEFANDPLLYFSLMANCSEGLNCGLGPVFGEAGFW